MMTYIGRLSMYQNIQLFILSKTVISNVTTLNYSLYKFYTTLKYLLI